MAGKSKTRKYKPGKFEPNWSAVRLMKIMVDKGYHLVEGSSIGHSFGHFLDKKTNKRVDFTPDQKVIWNHAAHHHKGWIEKGITRKGVKLSWYEHMYRINDAGRALVEEWREQIDAEDEIAAAKNKADERLMIIRMKDGAYQNKSILGLSQHICGLFRVTKATGKRFYGELIEGNRKPDDWGGDWDLLSGSPGNKYIEAYQVVVDNATPELFEKLRVIEREKVAELKAKDDQMEAEVEEIRRRYMDRSKQQQAMYSDMLVEAGMNRDDAKQIDKLDRTSHGQALEGYKYEAEDDDLSE